MLYWVHYIVSKAIVALPLVALYGYDTFSTGMERKSSDSQDEGACGYILVDMGI